MRSAVSVRADDTPVGADPSDPGRPSDAPDGPCPASSGPAGPAGRCAWPCGSSRCSSSSAVGYFAVSLFQVWSTGRTDQARPVDAIVVMGAAQYDGVPSPQLAARLDHVVELWPQGLAPLVVATGGNRPGDRFTEAQASAAYLTDRGVPADAILLEDQGTSSYESLRRRRRAAAASGGSTTC